MGPGTPYALAHRGGAGLAPENTLEAFQRAYALGVRYLETDVRVTADGVCVAFHDATLRRVTGTRGRVADLTWAQLSRLRVGGHPVPRLEDLFSSFGDARLMIDLKDPRALPELGRQLAAPGLAERCCLAGHRERWLAAARELVGPRLSTAVGWDVAARLALAVRFGRPAPAALPLRPDAGRPPEFLHLPMRLAGRTVVSPAVVQAVHELNLRLLVWTVDEPADMHQLLDMGADGIFTDRPDVLREVLVARGCWSAPSVSPSSMAIGPSLSAVPVSAVPVSAVEVRVGTPVSVVPPVSPTGASGPGPAAAPPERATAP